MHSTTPLVIGIPGPELDQSTRSLIERVRPIGYVLFSRNIKSAEQTRALTDELRGLSWEEPIIAIDQEGGRVTRTKEIGAIPPSARELSESTVKGCIPYAGFLTADMLSLLGINLNFAPVMDLDHHPDKKNALNDRCWGSTPSEVIDRAGMFSRPHAKYKVQVCGKHFPGSGLAQSDPHFDLPVVDISLEDLYEADLQPFVAMLPDLGMVMSGHLLFPQITQDLPASLSPQLIQGLLRNRLAYEGLAITDDLNMQAITSRYGLANAARMAIEAGNDLAMVCHSFDEFEAVAEELSKISPNATIDSERRLKKFQKKLKAPPAWSPKRWQKVNEDIFKLRVDVLGEDGARAPMADGTSPVESY